MRRDVFDFACIGDSLTSGYASSDWQPDVVALLSLLSSRPVRNYDLGLLGTVSAWGLANLTPLINMQPAAALIAFGMNDCAAVTLETYSETLRQMIVRVRQGSPGTAIFLMTMNPVTGTSPAATARAQLPAYYQEMRTIARRDRVGLIDNEPLWGSPTTAQIPDGVHPIRSEVLRVTVPNVTSTLAQRL